MKEYNIGNFLSPWHSVTRPGWMLDQVKYHYNIILGKMLQSSSQSPDDQEVPYLKAQHVQWEGIQIANLPTMWASSVEIETLRIKEGDLLVCEGGEVGRAGRVVGIPPMNCIIQNAIHLVRPKASGDTGYLRYLLRHATSQQWLDVLCNKATIAHFTVEKFSEMWAWFPPLATQRAIAAYLDRATAQIDALIAAKQRLLVLLDEKRRALISHVVTRGLDPGVPMRDSGVPWIGEVPAHWEVILSRNLIVNISQGWSPVAEERRVEPGEWGIIKLSAVKDGEFYPLEHKALPGDYAIPEELQLREGDFLLTRSNTPTLVGDVCIVSTIQERLIFSDLIYKLDLNPYKINPHFLKFFLRSEIGRSQIEMQARGSSASMVKISQNHIGAWNVLIPPVSEQLKIVDYLKSSLSAIAELNRKTDDSILLLQERRAALIAAAVTGQIDITG